MAAQPPKKRSPLLRASDSLPFQARTAEVLEIEDPALPCIDADARWRGDGHSPPSCSLPAMTFPPRTRLLMARPWSKMVGPDLLHRR